MAILPSLFNRNNLIPLIALAVAGAIFAYQAKISKSFYDATTTVTQESFHDDKSRTAFIQSFSPIEIPEAAFDITFKYDSWHDWNLDCSFSLLKQDFEAFSNSLGTLQQIEVGVYELKNKKASGKFTLLKSENLVHLECGNPAP